ncbi:MAG: MarR family transcriptional regulator [Microbacteriaceae bacterium]|nr:MarR family transcriptional regulator [Microbacteriaceae bacterium]
MTDERDIHDLSSELRASVIRLARRLRAEKADDGLTDGQTPVLGVLAVRGAQTLSQLSEIERVTLPSMNRTVGALVAAGYVERHPSTEDRRKVLLSLSAAGQDVVRETRRRRDEWLCGRLETLTPAQRCALVEAAAVLQGLAEN